MAGRGVMDEVPIIQNDRIKMLINGKWQPLIYPINRDRTFSGRSLVESFADAYQKEHNVDVGLIPCADGGTSISKWQDGEVLFDNAVFQASLAKRSSQIVGILWHQGENDCEDSLYPFYEERLLKMIKDLRAKLSLNDVPFIMGELGSFLSEREITPWLKNYPIINKILAKVAKENHMIGLVSAKDLKGKPDNLHFSTTALMEFGIRYYNEFKKLEKYIKADNSKKEVQEESEFSRL